MEERKSCRGGGDVEAKEKRVTTPQRRHHGLINQGATCYLNSVLQVLFKTTEFHDRLGPESQTDLQLREIFEDLKKNTCRTENITTTFGIKKVYEQRDAAECLKMILGQVSRQAAEVFKGEMTHVTKCLEGHINERTKPFWTLTLSLKDTPDTTFSVQNSFERMFKMKTYTGDNMVPCNECNKKTEATSICEMVEAPQILILLLKRFDFDYNTRSHFKSDCCVEVPCELQLENKTYKLYGMVNHMGSLRGGHYTATVLSEDNTWYECDDSHVSEIKHQPLAEDRTFSSRTVYLLMYRATELKTISDSEVLNQTEGEEDNTEENSNNKFEGMKETNSKTSCEQRLADKTKTERKEQKGNKNKFISFIKKKWNSLEHPSERAAGQKPVETTSEDLTDKLKEEQGEDTGPEEQKGNEEPKKLQGLHYGRYDQGDTNDLNLLLRKDSHDTSYSEEHSFERTINTKSFTGDNKVYLDEKMKTTSSSARKMITEYKVELINCLMADHSYILQHAHAKQIITVRQYQNIKKKSPSTPEDTVTDLIDYVIIVNGQKSCTDFLEVLKLPDVLSTYPQLKEIINKMLRSNSGSSA